MLYIFLLLLFYNIYVQHDDEHDILGFILWV